MQGHNKGNYKKDENYEPCLFDVSKRDWAIILAIFAVLYGFLVVFFYMLKVFNEPVAIYYLPSPHTP